MTSAPIRVVVVDDDPFTLDSITAFLAGGEDLNVVATARNGVEALETIATSNPDVVLMDLAMPVMGGIEAMRTIARTWPRLRVLALTSLGDDDSLGAFFAAGGHSYLLKTTEPHRLQQAVRAVHADLSITHPRPGPGRAVRGRPDVSARDLAVLRALDRGLSNRAIAAELAVSVSTVKATLASLLVSFEAANRTRLVARAHDVGWLP